MEYATFRYDTVEVENGFKGFVWIFVSYVELRTICTANVRQEVK